MFLSLKKYLESIVARDPAARSHFEILLCYPSVHAVFFHHISSFLWRFRLHLFARMVSQFARFLTGIEIHPGAIIGKHLFIDHGMGVVIGESVTIGDHVTLYHGVTLGGTTPSVDADSQRQRKRHPTIGDHVIIGSGAQVLGPVELGDCARIGANAVVTHDVATHDMVVGIPARKIATKLSEKERFAPYAVPKSGIKDTTHQAVEALMLEIQTLKQEVLDLKQSLQQDKKLDQANCDTEGHTENKTCC